MLVVIWVESLVRFGILEVRCRGFPNECVESFLFALDTHAKAGAGFQFAVPGARRSRGLNLLWVWIITQSDVSEPRDLERTLSSRTFSGDMFGQSMKCFVY